MEQFSSVEVRRRRKMKYDEVVAGRHNARSPKRLAGRADFMGSADRPGARETRKAGRGNRTRGGAHLGGAKKHGCTEENFLTMP